MDSLSVQESGVSTSESKSRSCGTAASRPSSTTKKPRAASASVSRKRDSSAKLWDSMDDPSVAAWIASLRAGRASLTPSPESASEPQMSDGSGMTLPAFSTNATRPSSSEKTSPGSYGTLRALMTEKRTWMEPQTTLLGEWEPFSGIWPRWGLCLSGEVYELPKWEPITGARESSCWPTADAQVMNDGADLEAHFARLELLKEKHGNGNGAGTPLAIAASGWWPTARAEDSESTGAHRGNLDMLTSRTEQWQTPRCPDGGRTLDEATVLRKGKDANGIKRTVDLSNQAEFWKGGQWPTPNTPSGGPTLKSTEKHRGGLDLDGAVENWATPAARDWKNGAASPATMARNARPLNEEATHWNWPTPTRMDSEQAGGHGDYRA